MNRLRPILLLLCALLFAAPVHAHLTPNSEVRLTFGTHAVTAEAVVPQSEFAYATGLAGLETPAARAAAARYLAANIAATAPDGRPWQVQVGEVKIVTLAGPPDLYATLRLLPPPGSPVRRFRLEWHVVTREVPSHFALVVEGGNLTGAAAGDRVLIGALTAANPTLAVDREEGALAGFAGSVALGARHIASGYDHLLFLLALLLAAPLMAQGGRWTGRRGARATVRHLALVVTGFTVGHSLTLVAATLSGATLPVRPVEAGIAASVLVSAIHAIRPLFPGREAVVATLFGLVHGLAFAGVLSALGLGRTNRALSLLGFNLGIELVQLAIVAAAMPGILWLARDPGRGRWRKILAGAIALLAAIWLAERIGGGG